MRKTASSSMSRGSSDWFLHRRKSNSQFNTSQEELDATTDEEELEKERGSETTSPVLPADIQTIARSLHQHLPNNGASGSSATTIYNNNNNNNNNSNNNNNNTTSSNNEKKNGEEKKSNAKRNYFWREYVLAELGLAPSNRENDEKSNAELANARQRVFDLLWHLPRELERLCFYGCLLCGDAILGILTSLPVRVFVLTSRGLFALISSYFFNPAKYAAAVGLRKKMDASSPDVDGDGDPPSPMTRRQSWAKHPLAREQLCDLLWLSMLAAAVFLSYSLDVSVLYHYVRGQEVIKLYMAASVLECFDKLCCSFNGNVLDALTHSVDKIVDTAQHKFSRRRDVFVCGLQLFVDVILSTFATASHTFVLLLHAVTLSVAMNSHTNAMLLVLISNNFSEMKGHVFKKQDEAKLFGVTRLDIIERVHLTVCLLFVAAQRIIAAGSISGGLTKKFATDCLLVLGSEVFVDIVKHSFMAKFNSLRPATYRQYFRQFCREHVKLAQSYKIHRVVGFVPLAPAALLLRVVPPLYETLRVGDSYQSRDSKEETTYTTTESLAVSVLGFLILVVVKLLFGVLLHHWGVRMLATEIAEKQRKLQQEGKNNDAGEGEDEAPILDHGKVVSVRKMMADNDTLLTPNFKVAM
ncbi:unnamed protein product [Bathycoccus prasinos]